MVLDRTLKIITFSMFFYVDLVQLCQECLCHVEAVRWQFCLLSLRSHQNHSPLLGMDVCVCGPVSCLKETFLPTSLSCSIVTTSTVHLFQHFSFDGIVIVHVKLYVCM